MKKRITTIISIGIGIIVFVLSFKYFYIDIKTGFETQMFELNYSSLPMFIDVIIFIIFFSLICYDISEQFLDCILCLNKK